MYILASSCVGTTASSIHAPGMVIPTDPKQVSGASLLNPLTKAPGCLAFDVASSVRCKSKELSSGFQRETQPLCQFGYFPKDLRLNAVTTRYHEVH